MVMNCLVVWLFFTSFGLAGFVPMEVMAQGIGGELAAPGKIPMLPVTALNLEFDLGDERPPGDPNGISALSGTIPGTWTAQGPGPAYNGQVDGIANKEVSGAIHTVAAHPTDPDILYIGAANGGVWQTTNATAASPTWTPLTDNQASLSIGALEFDPTDATRNTLVAGIGRYSNPAVDHFGGAQTGLLRTVDGGASWTPITTQPGGQNISGVAPRGATLVASSSTADQFLCGNFGVFYSTDTGTSWTPTILGAAFDLAGNPTNPAELYSGLTYVSACSSGAMPNGIYRSTDTGEDWTKVSSAAMDALIVDDITKNIEIAAYGNHVFVNLFQYGRSVGLFYSADNGTSWTPMDLQGTYAASAPTSIFHLSPGFPIMIGNPAPHGLVTGDMVDFQGVSGTAGANGQWIIKAYNSTTFSLNGSGDFTPWGGGGTWQQIIGMNPAKQGSIHASIVINPTVPTTVYLGGDWQNSPFPNYIGAMDFTGNLWRGDAAVAASGAIPSPQWAHLTHSDAVAGIPGGGTANNSAPHSGSREMVFDANGNLIEVNAGGIYRRTNPASNTGDWFSLNGNLQVTEIHDVAYDTLSNKIVSGNQYAGTTYQPPAGGTTWDSLHTADGGDVAVDTITHAASNESLRYSSFQNLAMFRKTKWDNTGTMVEEIFPSLTVLTGEPISPNYYSTVVVNRIDQNLVFGVANGLYESWDHGGSVTQVTLSNLTPINENYYGGHMVDYGGRSGGTNNPAILYAGSASNVLVRTDDAPATAITTSPTGASTIHGVALNPDHWQTAFAIDSDQVWMTTDYGGNWTDVTGNLISGSGDPVLRSVIALGDAVVVGGSTGVYLMYTSDPGTWYDLGTGLPNAPTWDLVFDPEDALFVAGTLGRGAWTLSLDTTACNDLTCYVDTTAVQSAVANTPSGGTVTVRGNHSAGTNTLTCNKTITLQSNTGANIDWTSGTAINVTSGNCRVKGLGLTGATTVFNQSGGTLNAYANNISGHATAYASSGGTAQLGQNYWGTPDPTDDDPGLPPGDWDKRLGAPVSTWADGTNSASLGDASLSGGTGTAVIVSFGRDNEPFGNGIAPHVDGTCSDYYDFFVRSATGTWTLEIPVDDNTNCNTNTLINGKLVCIPDISECTPATNPNCWDLVAGVIVNGQNLQKTGLTVSELGGTHFVAGTDLGNDPTSLSLVQFKGVSGLQPILMMALIPLCLLAAAAAYHQRRRS